MADSPILLLSEIFPPKTGGSGRWFWELYRRLPHDRVVIAAGEDAHQRDFDRSHGLEVHRVPLRLDEWGVRSVSAWRGYWRALRPIKHLLQGRRFAMIHCGRCQPEGWLAWLLKLRYGIPYVCYVHGEELNTAASSREFSWIVRRVFGGAEYAIANSRNTAAILESRWGLPASRVRQLYPGVDTQRFSPRERDAGVRERLGWGRRPVVLTVGRLQERKGHDQLIRATQLIRREVPDVLYCVVGDGEQRSFLERLVKDESLEQHVQFLSEVDDRTLIDCYQQCDLFVLPNREVSGDFEGFGMVLLEAQACGKPVVAGKSGGTAETMRVPETGLIVPCDTPEPIARAVTELLQDHKRRERMGWTAREWTVSQFDWSALSRRAAELFEMDADSRRNGQPAAERPGTAATPI